MSGNAQIRAPGHAAGTTGSWTDTLRELEEIRQLEKRITGLKRRLVTGARQTDALEANATTRLLLVRLGERLFALPMQRVEEVVRMVTLTPSDSAAAAVLGLVDYHGRPVAVIDPRGFGGEPMPPAATSQALVICTLPPLQVGLRVDEVVDVTQVQASDFTAAEEVLPGGLRSAGVARTAEGPALVLEPLLLAVAAELLSHAHATEESP